MGYAWVSPGVDPLGATIGVSSPITLTLLIPCTHYQVYVQDDCASDGLSDWIGPLTFQTANQFYYTYPYEQNFDSWNTSIPVTFCNEDGSVTLEDCWWNLGGEGFDWDVYSGSTSSGLTGPYDDVSGGGNYIYTEASECFGATASVFSPVFNFTPLSEPELSFYYHMRGMTVGSLSVDITTDGGTTWDSLWSLSGHQGIIWFQEMLSLLAYTDETSVQFRFTGLTGPSYLSDMALDQVQIRETPIMDVKVFLEGPFAGTEMTTELNEAGLIPLVQPYGSEPWYYPGSENVLSIPNADIVDWVLLEIRETTGDPITAIPDSIVDRKAAFLLNNGQVVGMDGESLATFNLIASDNYYLVLWHRNHLAIMSSVPLVESQGVYTYDFTDQPSKAYAEGQKEIAPGIFGMISGDCDANGKIEVEDKNLCWTVEAGKMGYMPGDWNLNAQVNHPDKNDIWVENFGHSTMIPEAFENCGDKFLDTRDNQLYNTVLIGNQCWMAENLAATKYNDGTDIPLVTGNSAWEALSTPAYCWYDNNESTYGAAYGVLYNWYTTVADNGLCPAGWHLPTDAEWTTLTDHIGGTSSPFGNELKSCRQVNSPQGGSCNTTEHPRWNESSENGTDDYGFSGFPGGQRNYAGNFSGVGEYLHWWSSTGYSTYRGWCRYLNYNSGNIGATDKSKRDGFSVRCLKDE